jgi:hypothetical protein
MKPRKPFGPFARRLERREERSLEKKYPKR